MRILHIIIGLNAGGAENMMLRLANSMPAHKIIIISLTSIGTLGESFLRKGYTVHALGLSFYKPFGALFRLWVLIRHYRPDVIQTWMYHSDLLAGIVARLAGFNNVVWCVRNTSIPQGKFSITYLIVKVCAFFSRLIPRSIVCCAHAGLNYHLNLGYDFRRMVVIPNGFDGSILKPETLSKNAIRDFYGLPQDVLIVGIVGRFDPLKGYDVFIEAAAITERVFDKPILFLMIGRDLDGKNKNLLNLIDQRGGGANFKLMGEQSEISKIMFALDLFCLSSKAEGFPNVVAEAMLMEIPCVVTNVGDAAIIVGTTGIVVPPSRPDLLASGMLELAGMSLLKRQELGRNARRYIIENFDIKLIARRYLDLYAGDGLNV